MIQFEKHWLTFYVYISRSHFPLNGRRKTGWKTLAVICWDGVWNQGSMGNWRSVIIKINQRCLSRRMVGDGKGCDICMRLIWHTLFALGKQNAASLVAQVVKNLPAMQETWVRKIPWRRSGCPLLEYFCLENSMERSLAGYNPWGCEESGATECLKLSQHQHTAKD